MNLTEMESKVREATNNEPWGASSTLMSQIAAGTYNYREREEIIAFIFRRFTEKAANEWRQIYKSLQLLEYLIKNGSERVIDDVRANVSLIQMLKSFHYIDSKGRDQGINVRNKSKNLIAFLNDDNQIRTERKKARQNAKKFGGVASSAMGGSSAPSFGSSSSYGGSYSADDDDFQNNRVYGDGGVYGERFADTAEEYNVRSSSRASPASASTPGSGATGATSKSKSKPSTATTTTTSSATTKNDLISDLLDFDDNAGASKNTVSNVAEEDDDDEFDDFVGAPASSGQQHQQPQQQNSFFQAQPVANTQFQQQQQQQPSLFQAQPVTNTQTPQIQKTQKDDPFKDLLSGFKAPATKPANNTNSTPTSTTNATNGDFDFL
ncbi:predicted protein [Candida tropicalis MYA-3404]|uniref:ENTH domain-containing protein n=1 Tax=Candida tropicalis (strain ATCC MYA-3404 / T1) TaxID=294747 RepID=C5M6A1_CANTT|nr:predicted protein [Candida tropicalis MYA-3404]EER34521.1 predicted protein [Candida tropicalis MYA-3404]